MCKGTCQKRCAAEAVGMVCDGEAHAACRSKVDSIKIEYQGDDGKWRELGTGFAAHETEDATDDMGMFKGPFRVQGAIQLEQKSDMARACEIGSRLGRQIVAEDMGADVFAKLVKAVGKDQAEYQLLKLVEAIGLRNWFDGDFVVLSYDQAEKLSHACDEVGVHPGWTVALDDAMTAAKAR